METGEKQERVLKILLKDISKKHTVTTLAKEIGISRVGAWKILKKLEKDKLINLTQVEKGKTNMYTITLNWDNPVTEKTLALVLTKEAVTQQRWISNFAELKNKTDFLILYGSIIHSPKEANDIDVLGIVSNKKNFVEINNILEKIQKTQLKKIHAINFTPKEFMHELKKPNKAFIDALKKGVILFSHENFIKFIKKIKYGD